jgi:hypothetical protein
MNSPTGSAVPFSHGGVGRAGPGQTRTRTAGPEPGPARQERPELPGPGPQGCRGGTGVLDAAGARAAYATRPPAELRNLAAWRLRLPGVL